MALTQLPFGLLPEPNPYRPDVPDSIRALDPELHDFLRELNDNLRRQHSATQAGDTTFSWQILTTLDETPRYSIGSQGRFSHPDYGLMTARYVRFESVVEGLWSGAPVGLLNGSESPWVVTNQFKSSNPSNVVGLPGTYTSPKNGQYGWVITNGVNIQTLTSTASAIPFVQMGWVGDDQVGPLKDTSSPLGSTLRHTSGEIGPGAFRVEVASNFLGAVFTDMRNRPTTETTFEDGLLRTITRLEREYANASFGLKIISEQLTRITENSVEVELNSYMQAFANFRNLADMASKNASKYATRGQLSAYAANESERRAAIYRNEVGFFAEAVNTRAVEVSLNEASARVSAGEAAEASLTAQGYAAQALEYVSLAATVGSSINPNPTFSEPWAQDVALPPKWPTHEIYGVNDITVSRDSPGRYGPYGWKAVRAAGDPGRSNYTSQVFPATRDNYLLHVEAFLDGPTWQGSGVLFRASNPDGRYEDTYLHFPIATQVDGTVGRGPARTYSWAIPVSVPAYTETIRLFLMPAWTGFGPTDSELTVIYYRCELRVSVFADDSGAQAYTDARITEVNLAIANETEARTTQYTNARTEYLGIRDNLVGQIGGVTTAVAEANTRIETVSNSQGATATRVDNLITTYNQAFTDVNGRVTNAVSSIAGVQSYAESVANALGAQATRVDNLVSSYDGQIAGINGWINGASLTFANYDSRITTNANAIGAQVTRIDTLYAAFNREVDSGLQQYVTEVLNKANAAQGRADSAFTAAGQAYDRGTEGVNNAAAAQGTANNAQDRITGVLGTLAGYDSRITTNSDATSAQAGRIDTAYAALRGETDSGLKTLIGSVSVVAQSAVDAVDGVKVRYGVYLNADNSIGGFELLGGGGRIAFTVRADDIAFQTDGGRKTPFSVSGSDIYLTGSVKINGTLILNGTVLTDTIGANQVTGIVTAQVTFVTASNGETKSIISVNSNVRGDGVVRIDGQFDARVNAQGTTGTCRVYMRRVQNGQITDVTRFVNISGSSTQSLPYAFWTLDNPPAGDLTYELIVTTDSGNRIFAFNNLQIMVQEFKR